MPGSTIPPPPGPVAVLFHEGAATGATQAFLRVIPELRARGWDLRFYVDRPSRIAELLPEYGYEPDGRRRDVGFSLEWLTYPPGPRTKLPELARWFAGLIAWLRSTRPALVHANSLYSIPDAFAARALGLPVFLQLLEMLPPGPKGVAARQLVRAAGVAPGAVSDACARRFAGDDSARLPVVVRTGVPFPDRVMQRPAAPSPLVVGTVGMVSPRKGSDVFVDLARRIRAERVDVEFRLIGANHPGPGERWGADILRQAEQLGIVHVPFADTFAELAGFDVFVLPSRFDPYPLVMMEAMSAGVAVVGADVDGIAEQVVPGTGVLARSGDAADFAAHVLELIDDPELRGRYGAAARAHAQRTFTLAEQGRQLDEAWRQTIAAARPRRRAASAPPRMPSPRA